MKRVTFKGNDLFICEWHGRICFIASQLSEVLGLKKRSLNEFMRNSKKTDLGKDYDIIGSDDALTFREQITQAGFERWFASSIIIYESGLEKYFKHMKNASMGQEIKELSQLLTEKGVVLNFEMPRIHNILETKLTDAPDYLVAFRFELLRDLYSISKDPTLSTSEKEEKTKLIAEFYESTTSKDPVSPTTLKKFVARINTNTHPQRITK